MTLKSACHMCLALGLLLTLASGRLAAGRLRSQGVEKKEATTRRKATAKPKPELPILYLREAETVRFSAPAPGIVEVGAGCAGSDVFIVYGTNARAVLQSPNGSAPLPVRKISPDSQTVTPYAVKSLGNYQRYRRSTFTVDRWGKVYAMYTAYRHGMGLPFGLRLEESERPAYVIVKFNNDGSVDSIVRLQDPPYGRLDPFSLGVFSDGQYLVSGLLGSGAGPGQTVPFTGIFDSSGDFERKVTLPNGATQSAAAGAKKAKSKGARSALHGVSGRAPKAPEKSKGNLPAVSRQEAVWGGRIFSGPTDNLYLMRAWNPAKLYVIAPSGQVVHHFDIPPPRPGLRLATVAAAGRSDLFAHFVGAASSEHGFNGPLLSTLVIVDAETGKETAAYRFPKGFVHLLSGCASGPNTFEFVGSTKNHKLKVVTFHGN